MLYMLRGAQHLIGVLIITTLMACGSQTQLALQKTENVTSLNTINSVTSPTLQQHFLQQVNILRAQARSCGNQYFPAAAPLKMSDRLNQAAYNHSKNMYEKNFLDHTNSNGDTLADRLNQVNYEWRAIAENIAHNQRNIEHVLHDWLSSPEHCRNIMSAEYRHTGIAQVNWYWTQVYAAPR